MKQLAPPAPCLLAVFALALAACGGGGGSEESAVEAVIERAATSADPANCSELQTQRFDEQSATEDGPGAVAACEAEAAKGEATAQSVAISDVNVEGDSATAEVAFSGGGFDGQTVEIGLVREGDAWKLDEILGFSEYDAEKFAESFVAAAAKEPGLSPAIASCIAAAFARASREEAEELAFGGSDGPLADLVRDCS